MRRSAQFVITVIALGTVRCKSEVKPTGDVVAKGEANAAASADTQAKLVEAPVKAQAAAQVAVQARIGGTVIPTGNFNVEVLAFTTGRVEAIVMDAKGELVAEPAKLGLVANLAAKGNAQAKVDLGWDALAQRFIGRVGAGVKLVPGPIEVDLKADGKAEVGKLALFNLAVEASHGGQIVVAGDYSVELVAAGGFVTAYVFDASGKAHAAGDLDLALDAGAASKLKFAWDAPSLSYKAKLSGDLDLNAKPIVLSVSAGGKIALGGLAAFRGDAKAALAAEAKLAADAKLGAAAKADLKLKVPDVSAQVNATKSAAAKAAASIRAPSVNVDVKKSASVGTSPSGTASAKAKVGFSLGTK